MDLRRSTEVSPRNKGHSQWNQRKKPREFTPSPSYTPRLQSYTIGLLLFTTKFPALSHHADRPTLSFHAAHVARGPSQFGHRARLHPCWEGLSLINPLFRTFPLSPFALDLPLSIPETPLLLRPVYHLDTAPPTPSATHPPSRT